MGILDFDLQDASDGVKEDNMSIPVKYVVLEGPDAVGKTTLYSAIHKTTKFRYNIHDRSCLSMLCYARLYGRDEAQHRSALLSELCDANNFIVVLMLPREVVKERLVARGDEFQDESSLMRLYDIFEEEVCLIRHLPNVHVVELVSSATDMAADIAMELAVYSEKSPKEFGHVISAWTSLASSDEVQMRVLFNLRSGRRDPQILEHPHESEYYKGILKATREVFDKEIAGLNPYGVPQGKDSRRFYYNSDTCISSIHCLPRGDVFKVIATLRSTDAVRNGSPDLQFLEFLSTDLQTRHCWGTSKVDLEVMFNSLHVRRDKV